MGADGADLRIPAHVHPLAGHGGEAAGLQEAVVVAELDGPGVEGAQPGEAGEGDHVVHMRSV